MPRRITTHSESETAAVGRDLAQTLGPGAVVLLVGDLGAGKTAFVRGLAEGLDETADGLDPDGVDRVLDMARDVIALGPGLGQAPRTREFVKALVDRATTPLVIDADGLNAFGNDPDKLAGREGRDIIITPHPGEMARLVGMSAEEVQGSRLDVARNFAAAHHLYVVLKGHRTLIATPDEKVFINPTGNPGMATGGTGDVLTGMIAAWLAQLLDAEAACKLAVYLHGMAGDLGAGKTAFVRGLAEGLGVAPDAVSSPTFTLIQEYRGGRLSLLHVDLYRLDDEREIEELGLQELGSDGVVAIEWADKLPRGVMRAAIAVRIAPGGHDNMRSIDIVTPE